MMADDETTPLLELITTYPDEAALARVVAGVLDLLNVRAVTTGPFFIDADDGTSIAVFADGADAEALRSLLPARFAPWDDAEGGGEDS